MWYCVNQKWMKLYMTKNDDLKIIIENFKDKKVYSVENHD